jgi:hypothetical protein
MFGGIQVGVEHIGGRKRDAIDVKIRESWASACSHYEETAGATAMSLQIRGDRLLSDDLMWSTTASRRTAWSLVLSTWHYLVIGRQR